MPVINVMVADVFNPQRVAILGTREGGDPQAERDRRLMIVYTGFIAVTHGAGNSLSRNTALSFVPFSDEDGNFMLDTFKARRPDDPPEAEIALTAALASFGSSPEVAAIDRAAVSIQQQNQLTGDPRVLVLRLSLAAHDGAIHSISYQVTVVVHPSMIDSVQIDATDSP